VTVPITEKQRRLQGAKQFVEHNLRKLLEEEGQPSSEMQLSQIRYHLDSEAEGVRVTVTLASSGFQPREEQEVLLRHFVSNALLP